MESKVGFYLEEEMELKKDMFRCPVVAELFVFDCT